MNYNIGYTICIVIYSRLTTIAPIYVYDQDIVFDKDLQLRLSNLL